MAVQYFKTNGLVREHDLYVRFMKEREEYLMKYPSSDKHLFTRKRPGTGNWREVLGINSADQYAIDKWHCIMLSYNIWISMVKDCSKIDSNIPYKTFYDVPADVISAFRLAVDEAIEAAHCDYNKMRPNQTNFDACRYLAIYWTYLDIIKDTHIQRAFPTIETCRRAAMIFGYEPDENPFKMDGKYQKENDKELKGAQIVKPDAPEDEEEENVVPLVEYVLDTPVDNLGFSTRTLRCLKRYDKFRVVDICKTTINELVRMRNFGRLALKEVKDKLYQLGFEYKDDFSFAEPISKEAGDVVEEPEDTSESDDLLQSFIMNMHKENEELRERLEQLKSVHERNKELSKENIDLKRERAQLNGRINELEEANRSFVEEIAAEKDVDILSLIKSIITEMRNNKIEDIHLTINGYRINIQQVLPNREAPSYGEYRIRTSEV